MTLPLVDKLFVLALAGQTFLTVFVVVWLAYERVPRVARGEISMADIAIDRTAYPLRARLLSNSFDNQFQLPVLFFIGALLALQLGLVGWADVALGWLFVVMRAIHVGIHVTSNNVPRRFAVFAAGLAVLVVFWLWLVIRILVAPSI